MIEIKKEILEKYQMDDCQYYIDGFGEVEGTLAFCSAFLKLTDHIPNKIIEAQVLGTTAEDYTEILSYRQQARNEINRLSSEQATK